jgi:hypothetical protein
MNRFFNAAVLCSIMIAALLAPAAVFASPEKAAQAPANAGKTMQDMMAGPSPLSGKVVETMSSGGYTYVLLESKGKKTWVAVPQMAVTVGQELALQPGTEMGSFKSKSLNKTFDNIIFSGGPVQPQQASAAPAGPQHGTAGTGSKAAAPADKGVKVEKAAGPNAYTVGDVFEKRAELDKKPAVVRGKVVKVSEKIMGSNWIHLQDGTGDAGRMTHDLVVTTQDLAAVGDIVTVNGTVSTDKDFGAGYKYSVLIEKASIQR